MLTLFASCFALQLPLVAQAAPPEPAPPAPDNTEQAAPAGAEPPPLGPDEKPPGYAAPKAVEPPARLPPEPAPTPAGAPSVAPTVEEKPRAGGAERITTHGGAASVDEEGWRFEFHGYIRAPMRVGLGHRDNPPAGQSENTFHAPIVPDDQYLSWQYTPHNPKDWAELYFSIGNDVAKGTVAIQAFNFTDAAWNNTEAQLGITEGYVTLTPVLPWENVRLDWRVGAFSGRYGAPGRYDAGPYDTYLFAQTHAMGETLRIELDVEPVTLYFEHGIGAKRPNPSAFNRARFTLLHHVHGGALLFDRRLEFGLHYLTAWAQEEDREGDPLSLPDGRLSVYGPELRFDMGRFGYFYAGYSHIAADDAVTVAPAIEVLHSFGGGEFELGVTDNYLDGPNAASGGNGAVDSLLGQYSLSLSTLIQGEEQFWGDGPDLNLSLYGMFNRVSSDDPDMDGVNKAKYGADVLWTPLSFGGVGLRYDRVQPHSRFPSQSFSILSPRLAFRSRFVTREQIELQYSRYFYNQRSCAPGDDPRACVQAPRAPAIPDGFGSTSEDQDEGFRGAPTTVPDQNVFTISATMWW